MDNNSVRDLYSHTSSIIAFDIMGRKEEHYEIASVDFNGVFQHWRKDNIIMTKNLWGIKNVPPEISKHQFLFDMGYPYYLKMFGSILAITTDLGLCIFKM